MIDIAHGNTRHRGRRQDLLNALPGHRNVFPHRLPAQIGRERVQRERTGSELKQERPVRVSQEEPRLRQKWTAENDVRGRRKKHIHMRFKLCKLSPEAIPNGRKL